MHAPRRRIIFPIVIMLIITGALLGVAWWIYPRDCSEKSCFVESANACKSAHFEEVYGGSVLQFRVLDCVLEKQFMNFSSAEPPQVVSAFSGKTMRCPYARGSFNATWISGLVNGRERCSGSLKDFLDELATANMAALGVNE
jgi:hypothetical protein